MILNHQQYNGIFPYPIRLNLIWTLFLGTKTTYEDLNTIFVFSLVEMQLVAGSKNVCKNT